MYGFHLRQQTSVLQFQIYVQELRHILALKSAQILETAPFSTFIFAVLILTQSLCGI